MVIIQTTDCLLCTLRVMTMNMAREIHRHKNKEHLRIIYVLSNVFFHQTIKPNDTQEIIRAGNGVTKPKPGDKLTMHYLGTLASNGSKFDASYDRGRPFEFTIGIGQVIKGWDSGVMQMSLGEKALLKITSDYGYGPRGAGGVIPPNAGELFMKLFTYVIEKRASI